MVKRNWRKLASRTGRHFGRALLGISAACTVVAVTVVIVPSAYGQGSNGTSAGTGSIQHTYTFTFGNETPNASQSGTIPESSSGCAGGLPFYQWELCMIINGSGNWVNYMEGDAYTFQMSIYGHLELHGPNGYYVNTPDVV